MSGLIQHRNPLANKMSDPVLQKTVKCKNHSSIFKVKEACERTITFSFSYVGRDEILNDVLSFKNVKACHTIHISSKTITENVDILTDYLLTFRL